MNLAFFNHPEGYVSNDSGSLNYVYQYKDHFEGGALIKGMVYLFSERASWRVGKRVSYIDNNNDGVISPSTEIIEEIDEGDSPNTKISKER